MTLKCGFSNGCGTKLSAGTGDRGMSAVSAGLCVLSVHVVTGMQVGKYSRASRTHLELISLSKGLIAF
jgi:sugar (pentulose or hexulose) kinase